MEMQNTVNYKELVNPTFATAQTTLEMLAQAGDENARKYMDILDIHNAREKLTAKTDSEQQIFTPEEGKNLMIGVTLGIEARYKMVNQLFKNSGYKNMLDIACGYTPRALAVKNDGFDYVGFDIPAVIDKMKPLSEKLFDNMSHPVYSEGDVTNAASLKAAADMLDGEVFISSEGLLQYLSESELVEAISNIRQVLTAHGGAWYSSDMEVEYNKLSAISVGNPDVLIRWGKAISALKKDTEVYFDSSSFESTEDKIRFFEKNGLKVERVPFYSDDVQLNMMNAVSPEKQEMLKGAMRTFCVWKMTVKDTAGADNTGSKKSDELEISYSIENGILDIKLSGRLDTLSAPELLELFETKAKSHNITGTVLNMQKLQYMSSTGLRVILKMSKALGSENVTVTNANDGILEVFETTGFSEVITIKK